MCGQVVKCLQCLSDKRHHFILYREELNGCFMYIQSYSISLFWMYWYEVWFRHSHFLQDKWCTTTVLELRQHKVHGVHNVLDLM